MWYAIQFAVFAAVIFGNIHWQWTPNHYLAALLGFGAVYLMMKLLAGLLWAREKLLGNKPPGRLPARHWE